jgi:hypothetical protein
VLDWIREWLVHSSNTQRRARTVAWRWSHLDILEARLTPAVQEWTDDGLANPGPRSGVRGGVGAVPGGFARSDTAGHFGTFCRGLLTDLPRTVLRHRRLELPRRGPAGAPWCCSGPHFNLSLVVPSAERPPLQRIHWIDSP